MLLISRLPAITSGALRCSLRGAVIGQRRFSIDGSPQEPESVSIPPPKQRDGETTDVKRARLLYQSRKRGMLENGIILSSFAATHLADMQEPDLSVYDTLINMPSNDWDIYDWAIGKREVPAEYQSSVMTRLQEYAQNTNYEPRIIQPSLYPDE